MLEGFHLLILVRLLVEVSITLRIPWLDDLARVKVGYSESFASLLPRVGGTSVDEAFLGADGGLGDRPDELRSHLRGTLLKRHEGGVFVLLRDDVTDFSVSCCVGWCSREGIFL